MSKRNESLDVSAKTIDEAVEQGLAQLGLTREQVDVEIIKEGKRGVFGIGAEEAHIRLIPKNQALREPAPRVETLPSEAELDTASVSVEPMTITTTAPSPQPEAEPSQPSGVEEIAMRCLNNLLKHMGIKATVDHRYEPELVEADEAPPLVLDITGGDLGILIGRHSETLQALQFMVRTMVSKETGSWHSIVVDVESYRARRRQALSRLAEKMAERVVASGKKVVLEAMPAHERRIIHIALRDHPSVTTKSVGSDDNRKVTIIPKEL
jgi:spoIIIJ-associated protein